MSLRPGLQHPGRRIPSFLPSSTRHRCPEGDLDAGLPSPGPQCPYRRTGFVPHRLAAVLRSPPHPAGAPGPPSARLPAKCRSINAGCENERCWATVSTELPCVDAQGWPCGCAAALTQEGWSPGAGRAERPCCRREAARAARLRTAPAVRAARRDYCETWADPVPAC